MQEGRERVKRAVSVLQEVAGPSYPLLFLKMGAPTWTPVGDEMLYKEVPGKNSTAALVICDSDGNAKTMSSFASIEAINRQAKQLQARGLKEFSGEVNLPV